MGWLSNTSTAHRENTLIALRGYFEVISRINKYNLDEQYQYSCHNKIKSTFPIPNNGLDQCLKIRPTLKEINILYNQSKSLCDDFTNLNRLNRPWMRSGNQILDKIIKNAATVQALYKGMSKDLREILEEPISNSLNSSSETDNLSSNPSE